MNLGLIFLLTEDTYSSNDANCIFKPHTLSVLFSWVLYVYNQMRRKWKHTRLYSEVHRHESWNKNFNEKKLKKKRNSSLCGNS